MSIKNAGASQYNRCCRSPLAYRPQVFFPPELFEEAVSWEMDFVRGRYEACDNESISVTVVPDLIQVPGGFTDSQKSDYPRGPWNWSIRILKIFVMPRCYFSEQRCQQGKSKSHSKPNKIKRYENMCSTRPLRSSQPFQGCLFQEVNVRKISPGVKLVYFYSKEIRIFWFSFFSMSLLHRMIQTHDFRGVWQLLIFSSRSHICSFSGPYFYFGCWLENLNTLCHSKNT